MSHPGTECVELSKCTYTRCNEQNITHSVLQHNDTETSSVVSDIVLSG